MTTKATDHLFVSETDGGLYDTRRKDWSATPIRPVYRRHFTKIHTSQEARATLRAGAYAWPGGYPLYLVTQDGAALCFKCAMKEYRQIAWDFQKRCSTGWRVAGCDVNYDDKGLACDHCGKQIESAYGD